MWIIVAVLVGIGSYVLVKYLINQSKGRGGAQYQELQHLIAAALPTESGYRVAYGFREDVEYRAKVTVTTYSRFAIAFRSDCLWVAPLGFHQKTNAMCLTAPMTIVHREELGMVTAHASGKKDILILELYRKDHSQPVNCHVEAANRRSNRFRHVNIYQPEVCETLCDQMAAWAEWVNPRNTELQATWNREAKNQGKANLSIGLGVFGICIGWIFGPLGLLCGLIGLLKARSAKKAGIEIPKNYVAIDIAAMAISTLNISVLVIRLITIA